MTREQRHPPRNADRRPLLPFLRLLGIAFALGACSNSATGSDYPSDGTVLRGVAVVSPGAESCLTLELDGRRYEPEGLPQELAQLGLRLRVVGVVHRRPSTCMVGPGLRLTRAERE